MTLPEKFCIAPFKNLVIDTSGGLMPCCDFLINGEEKVENIVEWWDKGLNQFRDDMLNGVVNKGCEHCLSKEKNKEFISQRQYLNTKFSRELDQTISDYKRGVTPSVKSAEFRASNYCKLKCIMCGDYASSAIRDEYQKNTEKYNNINVFMVNAKTVKWWDNDTTLVNIKSLLTNVDSINLAGGEPLLVTQLFEIVEKIQDTNNCKVSFSTSLYTKNKKIIDTISKFKNLRMTISIEGIGKFNNYIRYGSEWETIISNLKILKNINFSFAHVLQHTSVFALPAIAEFCKLNHTKFTVSEVFYGSYPEAGVLTINSAHPTDVDTFRQWLSTYNGQNKKLIENWVNAYEYDPILNKKFHQYMDTLDSIRGTQFKETFNPTYDIKL